MQNSQIEDLHLQIMEILQNLKKNIIKKINSTILFNISKKEDNTIVTDLDLYISKIFKQEFNKNFPEFNFFCEEDQSEWSFPLLILDPIDGTRELAKGIGECAVSFGVYFSSDFNDSRNFSWIFNPFTGFEINSYDNISSPKLYDDKQLFSFVSRTEFNQNLYQSNDKYFFLPKGSIAFKLGLLAVGASHFAITKKPKNIWDIAAGTHICLKRGIFLFQNGIKVSHIQKDLYDANLTWVSDHYKNRVLKI